MEEKILEILKENCYPIGELDDDEQCAKEITEHIIEFIEWYVCTSKSGIILDYQFWLNNVKK